MSKASEYADHLKEKEIAPFMHGPMTVASVNEKGNLVLRAMMSGLEQEEALALRDWLTLNFAGE